MANEYSIKIGQKKADFFDWTLFLCVAGLILIGLASIYSATSNPDAKISSFFTKQLDFSLIGIGLMLIIVFLPQDFISNLSYWVYGASIVSLILVLIIGKEVYGTKGWLIIFGSTFQPAETAKIALLMAVSRYMTGKSVQVTSFRDLLIVSLFAIVPIGLIMAQPDTGTATVLLAMMLGVFFWAGFSTLFLFTIFAAPILIIASLKAPLYFYIGFAAVGLVVFFFKNSLTLKLIILAMLFGVGFASPIIYDNLMPHQKARINTFLNPDSDPRGKGYNVRQSVMAVGSGGLLGKGFMQGAQTQLRYIPMQWTDFIYSVPTEEFGFIGGVTVILLMTGVILRSLEIAKKTDNKYFSVISIGAASIFLYHTLINIGMVINLTPVMGIPLPFMSYGGTSILANLILVGIMLNGYRNQMLKKRAL